MILIEDRAAFKLLEFTRNCWVERVQFRNSSFKLTLAELLMGFIDEKELF